MNMEREAREDTDCYHPKFEFDAAPKEVSLNETAESDRGSLQSISSDNTESPGNAESTSIQPPFEEIDKDEEAAATKQSATAPGKPRTSEIGCNFLKLEWEKPSERDISYYEIRFKIVTDTDWCTPVFSEFDKPCYQLRGLVPDTEYEFKVKAHYEGKEGDFSQKSDPFKTKQAVVEMTSSTSKYLTRKPGKPISLDAKEDHIQLGWDKPEEKNVKYYEIKYKSSEDENWSKSVFTENANTFYLVKRLLPETEYRFKVKSHHQTFEGEFSDVGDAIETTAAAAEKVSVCLTPTSSSRPGKPAALDVGLDYACIAWDKPDRCDVAYYEVKMKTTGDELWLKMPSFTENNKPFKKVSDLAYGTEYEFKVRGHFQRDEDEGDFSEKSDPIITNQPNVFKTDLRSASKKVSLRKPGKPCCLNYGCDFIDLGWERPAEKSVTYYELKSKTAHTKAWVKMPVVTDDAKTFCRMGGLSPSTQYVFKVRAYFLEEEGEFSDESDIITTSNMLEHIEAEDCSMSVVKFQERVRPTKEVPLGRPLTELTRHSKLKHADDDYLLPSQFPMTYPGNIQMEQEHFGIIEPRSQNSTQLRPIRDDDYLLHSVYHGALHTPDGSTTSLAARSINQNRAGSKHAHARQPSKPTRLDVGSDFILLGWAIQESEGVLYYEIKNRLTRDVLWVRDSVTTNDSVPQILVRGLLQDTGYTFKVRAHYRDGEGEFSEPSDSIYTRQSLALSVRNVCIKLQDGEPAFYKMPLSENKAARNSAYKTRKCEFGSSNLVNEKTIMMIGATGSGKSTLIDGMVNYLMGVKWEDDFRFKIIDLMTEEEARKGLEAESQTDWITSYRVHPMIKTVKFICNIIDTPGFGDTRGIERDQQLVDQIRAFFSTKGVKGIETIDAICFVTQAPLARLTHTQRYIYESILSIFGKDMQDNIVALVTFADGKEPPVLNALAQAEIPIKMHFVFNNSALFEPNTDHKCNRFGKMFWDMGSLSYGGFFTILPLMKTQSLQLTAEVLQKREQLKVTIEGLLPQIDIGLGDLETMRQERDLVNKYSREIADNQNFTYVVDEFHQEKTPLNPGEYVTNCTFCHYTCHYPCHIADDSQKSGCAAMTNGICTICPKKCGWNSHRNNDFRIKVTQVKVEKTYEEMRKKLEIAAKGKVSKEHVLQRIGKKVAGVKETVCDMIEKVRNCGNYLRKNALKANPLTEVEYLDVMMKSEQQQKKPGFESRVEMLKMFKRSASIKAKTIHMKTDDVLKDMGFHDMNL